MTATGLLVLVLAGLAILLFAATRIGVQVIERRHPPAGIFVDVEGTRVHLVDRAGPDGAGVDGAAREAAMAVVVIHGASSNLLDPLTALDGVLSDRYRRIYVDRPGLGYSARRGPGDASPAVQAARILAALEAIGVDRFVLAGHSFGASVVLQMALQAPERVAGLVFIAPASHPWPGGVSWYYELAAAPFAGRVFSHLVALPFGWFSVDAGAASVFTPEPVPEGYAEAIGAPLVLRPRSFIANGEDVAWLKPFLEREAPRYRTITAPTVILTGDSDATVLAEIHSVGLERDIAGAERIVIAGAGHAFHHHRPELVREAVDRVLRRASGEGLSD
ncbi:MAG: alpha/beta hydrolase [Hyphomicrobiaceae bacterium]|nr:alpha/beta hydrolase [Hyphomicrobiaceae bacterium]